MNQFGQAYSTFKLLIAAIVAVAILYILMSIIGIIPTIGGDIQTVTKQMIQKQAGMLGALDTSSPVSFNAGSNLAPSAMVGNSGLSANQVCVNKGDMADNENLKVQGKTIVNNGRTSLQVKVSVTCNLAKSLNDSLIEMGFDIDWGADTGNCGCDLDSDSANQKCCAVILRYA